MEKAITVPGLNMAQDEFLIAVEQVGKKRHVLTNTRTAIIAADSLIAELPHDAVTDVKLKGMLSLGALGKIIALVTGGGGPKTVVQLVPQQGTPHAPLNLKFSMMNQRAMLRFWGNLLVWVFNGTLKSHDAPPVNADGEFLPSEQGLDICTTEKTMYQKGLSSTPVGAAVLTERGLWYFGEKGMGSISYGRMHAVMPYASIARSVAARSATVQEFEDELRRVLEQADLQKSCTIHAWTDCQGMTYKESLGAGSLTFKDAADGKKVLVGFQKKPDQEAVKAYFDTYKLL